MGKKKLFLLLAGIAILGLTSLAMADSISPGTVNATIAVGGSVTIHKTVTVIAGPTTTTGDIFFLADTTGSMGGAIGAVKTAAAALLGSTSVFGDIAWGVGEYKDTGDTYRYRLNQDMTTTQASAQAGIDMWVAGGGGDTPEAQLPALKDVAEGTAWRAGSERVVVWFGDAPGHDPRDGVSEVQATAALVGAGIQVEAISVGFDGLDDYGQATRIATATGGHFYSGIDQALIVAAIDAALEAAFSTYSTVGLDTSLTPAGLGVSIVPLGYAGSYDCEVERTFSFDLTFTGLAPGTYEFDIFGTVDGGRVATERDTITVTGVPEPATLLLFGSGLVALAGLRKRIKN